MFRHEGGRPVAVEAAVMSAQHGPDIDSDTLRAGVGRRIIAPAVPPELRGAGYREFLNPTGRFEIGGPMGGTGLTGRKIIADIRGGPPLHGGGAFSGKNSSKVDRSATYMARLLARQVVARAWARRAAVRLACAIGQPGRRPPAAERRIVGPGPCRSRPSCRKGGPAGR
ncbi:MAG: hypothetical protein Fur0037_14920 [Planctomycetota bacterium]